MVTPRLGRRRIDLRERKESSINKADVVRILARHGIAEAGIRTPEELPEGTFNTVFRIRLTDGTGLVCKISPSPDTLSHGELVFYRCAAITRSVPVPTVVQHDFDRTVVDRDVVIMTECPGRSWHSLRKELGEDDQARLRRHHRRTPHGHRNRLRSSPEDASGTGLAGKLSHHVRHTVRGRGTLPPQDTGADFRTAGQPSRPRGRPGRNPNAGTDPFRSVERQYLLDFTDGRPEISGVVDGERAFWGDPVAKFVSLAFFGDIERDEDFLRGYREAGGSVTFNARARA